jgi:cobyrinic acid a,c-diamide synthase
LGNDAKIVSECSKLMILLSEMNDKQSKKIEMVREKYEKYFAQELVLRVDGKVKVGF